MILMSFGLNPDEFVDEPVNPLTADDDSLKGRYSNSIAECINNKLKTIVKDANGYRNFIRFRKRVLLICSYGKNRKQVNRSPKKKKNK